MKGDRLATVYAAITIREKTHMDPVDGRFVFVADHDPATRKGFLRYNDALLHAVKVLLSYATE